MYTKTTYIGTLNGTNAMWCGFYPEDAIITEERIVLYPESGYSLKRISTEEVSSSIWLQDGDSQENYTEIPAEQDTEYANLCLTRGDVFRGLLLAKGITRQQVRAKIEAMPQTTQQEQLERELALIDFDEALHFYRALPLIDRLGTELEITPAQMTAFFITNDWHKLVG